MCPIPRPYKSPRVHTFCMSLSAHDNNDVIIVLSISLAVRSSTKTESQPRQDIASLLLDFDHLPKNIESPMTKSSMNTPEVNKPSILGLGRHVPTLPYAIQNVLMSVASIIAATLSLIFTMSIVLPLSIARVVLPNSFFRRDIPGGRGKVVLIVGASRGIGFNVLKQYADEPDTVIIAASRSIGKHNWAITFPQRLIFFSLPDSLRKAVIELGDTRAIIQCAELDLTTSKKQLAESIRSLDKQYGPVTHLYEVSGISNHLKDGAQWGLVCPFLRISNLNFQ